MIADAGPVKSKHPWLNRIRQWWWDRQFKKAKFALSVMLANRDPEIYNELGKAANELARQMCMRWLDNQGIQHCARCPNTKPLVSLGGIYYCAPHAGQIAQERVKNGSSPVALVKP